MEPKSGIPDPSNAGGQTGQDARPTPWPALLAAAALVCLVGTVFLPALSFEFANLDLPEQVIENPYIKGLTGDNLKKILTSPCIASYYPVRTLTFAIDYQIWQGLDPRTFEPFSGFKLTINGFKLTNVLVHLANVLLLFWLLLRLLRPAALAHKSRRVPWGELSVATFSAGVFAVHPVVVEPVAWVPGREELLMTLGALGCLHCHLTARRLEEKGGSPRKVVACHVLAALCCALACLSNAVGAVIPLLIVTWDLLTLAGPKLRRIVYGTSALWGISAATIVIKKLSEGRHPDAEMGRTLEAVIERLGHSGELVVGEPAALCIERLTLALNVYWLNLKTLVWPADLAFSYGPVRPRSLLETEVILGAIAVVLSCAALWMLRRQKGLLLGMLWFGLALGPTAQIMPHHIHRADRFLYLPLVGLAVALAMALRALPASLKGWRAMGVGLGAGLVALCLLARLSAAQVQTWRSNLALWENSVRAAPESAFGHQCFAKTLAGAGQFERAFAHYETALRLNPYNPKALNSFAHDLVTADDREVRDYDLAVRLAEWGCQLTGWKDRNLLHTLAAVYNNLAEDLRNRGQFGRAIDYYGKACKTDTQYAAPVFNLSLLLATCDDPDLRRADEAVRLAERACRMVARPDANQLMILAIAHAQAGHFDRAVGTTERAIAAAEAQGDPELAELLRSRLRLYQGQEPSRPPAD